MGSSHKNGKTRPRSQKWVGLGGGSKLRVLTIWLQTGNIKKTFAIIDFRKILKIYFLNMCWFREVNHLLGAGGGPKIKKCQNCSFKYMYILHKIAPTETLCEYLAKFDLVFEFFRWFCILYAKNKYQKEGASIILLSHQSWRPKYEISILRVIPYNMYTNW